jgi:phage-related protein
LVHHKLAVLFFRTASGNEPVRTWLKSLDRTDMKTIGTDIMTIQFTWPTKMPLVRPLGGGLFEVRSGVSQGNARVFFTIEKGKMVLLHGIIKKSQKTPKADLNLARERQSKVRGI